MLVDDSASGASPVMVYVLDNDTLPEGVEWVLSIDVVPLSGTVDLIGNDKIKYTANESGFVGEDSFVYKVCIEETCSTATVTVTVEA